MKKSYIRHILGLDQAEGPVQVFGWLSARRNHGGAVFLDISDSTGQIQAVAERNNLETSLFNLAKYTPLESAVSIEGLLRASSNGRSNGSREVVITNLRVIGGVEQSISPRPHEDIDIFDEANTDHLLKYRHLYIRNPQVAAALKFRHVVLSFVRSWFERAAFVEITAPVLTTLPLYDDRSVMKLEVDGETAYLTQCVGFYLEASVHSLERVYNIGPSFRGEESRSKRHLMEYWHIKAELAFAGFEDVASIVENLLRDLTVHCNAVAPELAATLGRTIRQDALLAMPFPRITYREAIERARAAGANIKFGQSLSSAEEELLAADFASPFWVTGIPRTIEPFPYVIDPTDREVTRTADLILPAGYGELLGIAEKISDLSELDERLAEKGKSADSRYEWLRELRRVGCVPHAGFGMGVERLIRWLLDIPHVRDAMPFPRIFRRRIYP